MTRRRVERRAAREPKVHQAMCADVPVRVVSGELCGTILQTIKPITRHRPKNEMAARCLPVHASRTRGFTKGEAAQLHDNVNTAVSVASGARWAVILVTLLRRLSSTVDCAPSDCINFRSRSAELEVVIAGHTSSERGRLARQSRSKIVTS